MLQNNLFALSYNTQKQNNLAQLKIIQLQQTILEKQKRFAVNQVKQLVSKVFSIFCQTQQVYKQLKIPSLYQQNKKLFNCLGMIFINLVQKVQKKVQNFASSYIKAQSSVKNQSVQLNQTPILDKSILRNKGRNNSKKKTLSSSKIKQLFIQNSNNIIERVKPKRCGGVFIFNQQIKRHIQNSNGQEKSKYKKNSPTYKDKRSQRKRFMDQVRQIATKVDPDDLAADEVGIYLSQRKQIDEKIKHMQFNDELQKIATFFKDSQNQALQFLKSSKDHNTMLQFTQSFHRIVVQYKSSKNVYVQAITAKAIAALQMIKDKYVDLKNYYQQKESQLKNLQIKSQKSFKNADTQTVFDIISQIKKYQTIILNLQEDYKILQMYKNKQIQEQVANLGYLGADSHYKDQKIKKLQQDLSQKTLIVEKLQKKIKIAQNNIKTIRRQSFLQLDMNTKSDIISQIFDQSRDGARSNKQQYTIFLSNKHKQNDKKQNDDKSQISSFNQQPKFTKKRRVKNMSHELKVIKKLSNISKQKEFIKDSKRASILLKLPIQNQDNKKRKLSKQLNSIVIQEQSQRNMKSEKSVKSKRNIKTTEKRNSIFRNKTQQKNYLGLPDKVIQNTSTKYIQKSSRFIQKSSKYIQKSSKQLQKINNNDQSQKIQMKKTSKEKGFRSNDQKYEKQSKRQESGTNHKYRLNRQKHSLSNAQMKKTKYNDYSSNKQRKQALKKKSRFSPSHTPEQSQCQKSQQSNSSVSEQQKDDFLRPSSKNNNDKKTKKRKLRKRVNQDQNHKNQSKSGRSIKSIKSNLNIKLVNEKQQQQCKSASEIGSIQSYKSSDQEDDYQYSQKKSQKSYRFFGQIFHQFSITLNLTNELKNKQKKEEDKIKKKTLNRNSVQSIRSGKNVFNLKKQRLRNQANQNTLHKITNRNSLSKEDTSTLPQVYKKSEISNSLSNITGLKREIIIKKKSDSNFCIPNKNQYFQIQKQNRHFQTMPDQIVDQHINSIIKKNQIKHDLLNMSSQQDSIMNVLMNNQNYNQQQYGKQNDIKTQLQAIKLARKCKSIQQFKKKIQKIHKLKCGQKCIHLKRYLQNFIKYQTDNRQTLKLHIQNLNQNIEKGQNQFIMQSSSKGIVLTQKMLPSLKKIKQFVGK